MVNVSNATSICLGRSLLNFGVTTDRDTLVMGDFVYNTRQVIWFVDRNR